MLALWIILLLSAVFHFILVKALKRLRNDYLHFKAQRGIDEEYKAWRTLILQAIFENFMVFVVIAVVIFTILTGR
jgi:hypothetical protein